MFGIARFLENLGVQPTVVFCCGCNLIHGVYMILGFHLLACFGNILTGFMAVMFDFKGAVSCWGLALQIWFCGMYLGGIPIIASAAYGVWKRHAAGVWIYFTYLTICTAYDTTTLIKQYWLAEPCDTLHSFTVLLGTDFGESFVCGCVRLFAVIIVLSVFTVEFYCIYVVWSFCENVHLCVISEHLDDLIVNEHDKFKRMLHKYRDHSFPNDDVTGLPHAKTPGPYPSPYGSVEQSATYPHNPILGGTYHAMAYPPGAFHSDKPCPSHEPIHH